jgi:hypothetical protein
MNTNTELFNVILQHEQSLSAWGQVGITLACLFGFCAVALLACSIACYRSNELSPTTLFVAVWTCLFAVAFGFVVGAHSKPSDEYVSRTAEFLETWSKSPTSVIGRNLDGSQVQLTYFTPVSLLNKSVTDPHFLYIDNDLAVKLSHLKIIKEWQDSVPRPEMRGDLSMGTFTNTALPSIPNSPSF